MSVDGMAIPRQLQYDDRGSKLDQRSGVALSGFHVSLLGFLARGQDCETLSFDMFGYSDNDDGGESIFASRCFSLRLARSNPAPGEYVDGTSTKKVKS